MEGDAQVAVAPGEKVLPEVVNGAVATTPEATMNGEEVDPHKMIEVERKFLLKEDSESKLKDLGAEFMCESTFTDSYYDTKDYALTLADHWLRKRNDAWELKCPPEKKTESKTATQYVELDNEKDIVKVICNVLEILNIDGQSSIMDLLKVSKCDVFATYTTVRKSYSLDGFRIDLDCADFGYQVGEIELLVVEEERIAAALDQIDELASKLDLCLLGTASLPIPPVPQLEAATDIATS